MSEAQRLGQAIEEAGKSLGSVHFVDAFSDGRSNGYVRNKHDLRIQPYQEVDRVNELLDELRTVCACLVDV